MIFDRAASFYIGGITVCLGVLSLATILIKLYLCVMAALLLIATTPFTELTAQLRRLHVPMIFIMVFEMTFRYISVLFEEVYSMTTAYKLRSGNKKSLDIQHMGSFVGQLLLRGFDRAERVHAAMRCRGYSLNSVPPAKRQAVAGVDEVGGGYAHILEICVDEGYIRLFIIGQYTLYILKSVGRPVYGVYRPF